MIQWQMVLVVVLVCMFLFCVLCCALRCLWRGAFGGPVPRLRLELDDRALVALSKLKKD